MITKYCGQTHSTCQGLTSAGTFTQVSKTSQYIGASPPSIEIASTVLLRLPAVDGGGRAIVFGASGIATCASRLNFPYMTDYSEAADCTGSMKGFNIYITSGPGAGSVGLIRAGPDE